MNARTNPFASRQMESLDYQCTDMPLKEIMARLQTLHYRAAIVGPEGSGKTTLLETIGNRLRETGFKTVFIKFDTENNRLNKNLFIPDRQIPFHRHAFLIDGAEQLSRLSRIRLYASAKKAGALVITSHRTTKLPILVQTSTSPALLYDLVLKLVGQQKMTGWQEINRLFEIHNGNIRLALRTLYDTWSEIDE